MHRTLPPSVIAGVSIVCAVGPWLFTEPLLLRGLAAGVAVTTAVGAFVMHRWDMAASKRVADLTRARASDEWRHEERVAELETDLEESRELRTKLENKLRAKRTELAKLRNEHAGLLRRYATAETERASALEGRRLLAIETTAPVRALPPAETRAPGERVHGDVASAAVDGPEKGAGSGPSAPRVFTAEGSSLFARADSALARLAGRDADVAREEGAGEGAGAADDTVEEHASARTGDAVEAHASAQRNAHFIVPAAAAVVPAAPRRRPAVTGGFDYFGTQKSNDALDAVQNEDLADVVGQEALAVHKAESESGLEPARPQARVVSQVIDLTAHDETERIDI
ncbi:MAG: hypothetical protein LBV60_12310, partial [Streptomyces sp.]|nr:hypothetical protein [Streptomyces sp.]